MNEITYTRTVTRTDQFIVVLLMFAAFFVLSAGAAHADPSDPPPYQIGRNPSLPGMQPYQPHCAVVPISCGFSYDPGDGTWSKGDDS